MYFKLYFECVWYLQKYLRLWISGPGTHGGAARSHPSLHPHHSKILTGQSCA